MPRDHWHSPLNTVSGRELGLLIGDFAGFIDSEVALLSEPGGTGQPAVICSWGTGAPYEQIAWPREGGFVGRALHSPAQRAALEAVDRSATPI